MYSSDERTIRELISQLREQKVYHMKEIGALRLKAQRERERTKRCESELLDLKGKLDFRLKQANHLKGALSSRAKTIEELEQKVESLTSSMHAGNTGKEDVQNSLKEAHRKLDAMQLYIDKLSGTLTKITEDFTKGRLETEKVSEQQLSKLHRDFQEERIKRHTLDQTLQLLQQQQNKEHGANLLELLALSRTLP